MDEFYWIISRSRKMETPVISCNNERSLQRHVRSVDIGMLYIAHLRVNDTRRQLFWRMTSEGRIHTNLRPCK